VSLAAVAAAAGRRRALFTPQWIASQLLLWQEADVASDFSLDGSGRVISWASRLAGLPAIGQATAGSRPLYDTSTWTVPSAYGDGTRLMSATGLSVPGDFVTFLVQSTTGFLEEEGNSAFGEGGDWAIGQADTGLYVSRSAGASTLASAYSYTNAVPAFGAANAALYEHRCDGTHAGHTLTVNGVAWPITAKAPYLNNPGASNVSTSAYYLIGNPTHGNAVARVVAACTVAHPTAANVLSLRGYFQRKYKLFGAGEGVSLGDSTSAAFDGQRTLASYVRPPEIDPLGSRISVLATAGDRIANQKTKWDAAGPKGWSGLRYAIVMVGANDLLVDFKTSAQCMTDLNALCNDLRAANPSIKIIVLTPLPLYQRALDLYGAGATADGVLAQWTALYNAIKAGGITAADAVIYGHTDLANDGTGRLKTIYLSPALDGIHENNLLRELTAGFVLLQLAVWSLL
jgi:hypothetical protein